MLRFRLKIVILGLLMSGATAVADADTVRGYVYDRQGKPLSDVSIEMVTTGRSTLSDSKGHFLFKNVPSGIHLLIFRAIGYLPDSVTISPTSYARDTTLRIELDALVTHLNTVTVRGDINPGLARSGNKREQKSLSLLYLISQRSIKQSADVTVGDMVQRASGVSVISDESTMANKAIIRGMDSKYSYMSVNGIPIPSPDDRSRYLPMDIFTAGMIDHLEIYKARSAAEAADAIGGMINVVTRSAPKNREFSFQLTTGYEQLFLRRSFLAFNSSAVDFKSPYEHYGPLYYARGSDFTKSNLSFYSKHPGPDMQGNVQWGQRFFHKKLGVLATISWFHGHAGSDNFLILQNNEPQLNNVPGITDFIRRHYSTTINRKTLYSTIAYRINEKNNLRLYQLFIRGDNIEARSSIDTSLSEGRSGPGTGRIALMKRSRWHRQSIEHINLRGTHQLNPQLSVDWSGVFSIAKGSYPDWAELIANTGRLRGAGGEVYQTPLLLAPLKRTWLHNTEKEKDFVGNLHYIPFRVPQYLELSGGSLLQFRHRDNFFNNYTFSPSITESNGQPFTDIYHAQWLNDNGPQNPRGTVNTPGTYRARENIAAFYGEGKTRIDSITIVVGLREEQTVQDIHSAVDASSGYRNHIHIHFNDWLPSFQLQAGLNEKQNIKLSYYKAISRPALYNVTFFNVDYDDYNVAGNPFLKRSTADNFDIRYELYNSKVLDKLQGTIFYKQIHHPFEKTLLNAGDTLYKLPENGLSYIPVSKLTEQLRNYNTAQNWGVELTLAKEWNKLYIEGNYTFTSSRIEQPKRYKERSDPENSGSDIIIVPKKEIRPLQGQSKHVASLSFTYHLPAEGLTVRLNGAYSSRRIADVSGWYGLDSWEKGYMAINLSAEKGIRSHWHLFFKVSNMLNSRNKVYVKGFSAGLPEQTESGRILVESSQRMASVLLGIRYGIK